MTTSRRLDGRRCVVTGASTGLGRAIALAFAREGANLVLTYRKNATAATSAAEEVRALGARVDLVQVDVSSADDVEALCGRAFSFLGGVDAWVNNAGADILTGEGARLPDLGKLEEVLGADLKGTVLCSWNAAERLKKAGGGVIVNVSWDHVLTGAPGRLSEIYAAAKGGVLAFSKCLARSFAPEVRVHVLAPGWIQTAFAETLAPGKRDDIARGIPLGRWGTPEDVAGCAVFLASADAAFLTGTTLLVNGGAVM